MSRELICNWLKLPPDRWPPDHYSLVGLEPGESDRARIEQHVHERHEWLMRYQLTHPEAVTEALNCLARAFDCLTDPEAKKAYDAALFPERTAPPSPPVAQSSGADPLAWLYGSWGQQAGGDAVALPASPRTPAESSPAMSSGAGASVPPLAPAASPLPDEPIDPVVRVAGSPMARRGLGTKRALYYRISRTRQLLRAWINVGHYVGDATFTLQKRADAVDLRRQLDLIRELLHGFPPLLGQAGQPGYLVVALARQPMIVPTFLGLLPSQREALVRDWQAGLTLLAAHRLVLREELWVSRRRGWIGRATWAARTLIAEYPGSGLLLAALLALNLIYAPPLAVCCLEVGGLLLGTVLYLLLRSIAPRRRWLHRRRHNPQRTIR